MLTPCELVIKRFLPTMRAIISKQLAEKYRFKQREIAHTLGLTQAAVSKYLSGNYTKEIKELEKNQELQKMASAIASEIARKKLMGKKLVESLCISCQSFAEDKVKCKIRGASIILADMGITI